MLSYLLAFAPSAGQGQQGGGFAMMLPWLAILVVVWLLILRPQAKRQKEQRKMLEELSKGDKIVTNGGLHGEIQRVNDKEGTIVVKVADGLKLTFERGAVVRKILPQDTK